MGDDAKDFRQILDDYEAQYPLLVRLARMEVEQTRINLNRELAEWKEKWARLSRKTGKYRRVNKALKKNLTLEQIKAAYREERERKKTTGVEYVKALLSAG